MANESDGTSRLTPLSAGIYLTALLLVVISMVDFGAAVWPIRLDDASWRYGAVGLFSGFMLTPLLGALLGVGYAVYAGHRRTARTLAIVTLIFTVLLVLALVSFSLDALQARREAAPESLRIVTIGVIRAALKHGAAILAFGAIGLGGLRVPKRAARPRSDEPDLVVGRGR